MHVTSKIARFFFSIYGFIVFVAGFLFIFPLILLALFWGRVKGGNIIYVLCRVWADVFMALTGIFHTTIYEAPHHRNRPYIFVSNHNSFMDIPQMMKAVRRQQLRILAKAEMGKVPLFGILYNAAVVAVERTSAESRVKSIHLLKSYLRRQISIFICPEGTFNMTDKPLKTFYDGAFRIAIETQTPIKPLLFLDAADRLHWRSIFSLNPGRLRTVYLAEIAVDQYTLADVEALKQQVYTKMEEGLIRYKVSWIHNP